MGWLYLAGAILAEVTATITLRGLAHGWRVGPGLAVVVLYACSFALLALTLRSLSVSTAYAVWSGAGTAGVTMLAVLVLGERLTWFQVGGLVLIVVGVGLLHTGEAGHTFHSDSGLPAERRHQVDNH